MTLEDMPRKLNPTPRNEEKNQFIREVIEEADPHKVGIPKRKKKIIRHKAEKFFKKNS